MPLRDLALRSRAEYRAARFPAPGRRSARRLRWFGCLVVCRTEPPRRPAENKARCAVVRIIVAGRSRHVGGCATAARRCEGESGCLGGFDHRDWLSTHSAVRHAVVSFFFCRIFKCGWAIPQHARLSRWAPVGGGGRKWHSRGEVKSRKRAPRLLFGVREHPAGSSPVLFRTITHPATQGVSSAPPGSVAVCQGRPARPWGAPDAAHFSRSKNRLSELFVYLVYRRPRGIYADLT